MVQASKKITEKRLKWYGHVSRMKEEHSDKNVRCGHTGEKKKRTAKPMMERCMQERHGRSGSDKGQHNKHGRMEENVISYTGDPR